MKDKIVDNTFELNTFNIIPKKFLSICFCSWLKHGQLIINYTFDFE